MKQVDFLMDPTSGLCLLAMGSTLAALAVLVMLVFSWRIDSHNKLKKDHTDE